MIFGIHAGRPYNEIGESDEGGLGTTTGALGIGSPGNTAGNQIFPTEYVFIVLRALQLARDRENGAVITLKMKTLPVYGENGQEGREVYLTIAAVGRAKNWEAKLQSAMATVAGVGVPASGYKLLEKLQEEYPGNTFPRAIDSLAGGKSRAAVWVGVWHRAIAIGPMIGATHPRQSSFITPFSSAPAYVLWSSYFSSVTTSSYDQFTVLLVQHMTCVSVL